MSLFKIAADPDNKSAVSAYRAIMEVTGQAETSNDNISDEAREAVRDLLYEATKPKRKRKRSKDPD